ncbi:hypothetical protein ACYPKM_01045 [Pseudomonas aeruginosa]
MAQTNQDVVLRRMDSDLELLSRYWHLDGDLYRCTGCNVGHLASKANRKAVHSIDCPVKDVSPDYPWRDLARFLTNLPKPDEDEGEGEGE